MILRQGNVAINLDNVKEFVLEITSIRFTFIGDAEVVLWYKNQEEARATFDEFCAKLEKP